MKIKCPYCDTMFDDTLINCPNCGAASEGVVRTEQKQPVTIEQLQQWYRDRGLPPYETTRFFIGENYKDPRAFGIYKDENTGNFVVYKNLSNGQRKVRYEGTDEAYAVNELYMRLKEEIIQQKRNDLKKGSAGSTGTSQKSPSDGNTSDGRTLSKQMSKPVKILIAVIIIISIVTTAIDFFSPSSSSPADDSTPSIGYYDYDDITYYHALCDTDTDNWYYFDTDNHSWEHTYDALPADLTDTSTANDFYYTPTWDSTTQENDFDSVTPFDESEYASQYESDATDSWDNDDDNDFNWDDNDTWDNGTTDWDDDW